MKLKTLVLLSLCVGMLVWAGCDGGGGGPTGPANAPLLYQANIMVTPQQANPGATIVLAINFVDVPGDLNGGLAVITDAQGNTYQGLVSNAEGTAGTLTTSFELSLLLPPGELLLNIFVQDLAGNSSNTVFVTITIV